MPPQNKTWCKGKYQKPMENTAKSIQIIVENVEDKPKRTILNGDSCRILNGIVWKLTVLKVIGLW